LIVLLVGCGGSTTQVRRSFPVEVVATLPSTALESGWTVSDVTGTAQVSGLRFYEGRVLVARGFNPLDLIIAPAYAHPGHYVAGEARAEVLAPLEVDLASRDVKEWSLANGVTGNYGSAELLFGATAMRVRGTATKGATNLRFDTGAVSLPKPLQGLRFEYDMTTDPGRVRLEIDLGTLLSRVDFSAAGAMPGPDGVLTFSPSSPAFNGFERGVTDTSSYRLTWQPN
jgi:hypothetical protein